MNRDQFIEKCLRRSVQRGGQMTEEDIDKKIGLPEEVTRFLDESEPGDKKVKPFAEEREFFGKEYDRMVAAGHTPTPEFAAVTGDRWNFRNYPNELQGPPKPRIVEEEVLRSVKRPLAGALMITGAVVAAGTLIGSVLYFSRREKNKEKPSSVMPKASEGWAGRMDQRTMTTTTNLQNAR